ncbi:rod-binding protein [Serpentinicella alkaliphila]|uniref:Flagellar protein FlgJ n=1 Tax=Serpentinicella alkaliphila TaxID=1734049 RepID=A0A4R2U4X3_9FIRM|nr:rod-binding protein [Serpentinicella alkaliphila]QUH24941.1 rod-binding protein [Serpentinicella alkaliphila]TCQ02743.1 flagellar protein FlgJ [Serpentinicella alkaliphila]
MKINEMFGQHIIKEPTDKLNREIKSDDEKKMMQACKDFEAIFVNLMLKQMRSTISHSDLVEKSYAREIFESMQDEKLAEEMTKGQGVGLAQQLYKQLSRNMRKE